MVTFPTCAENKNSYEINHFSVLKQAMKVQFLPDVLGNYFTLQWSM